MLRARIWQSVLVLLVISSVPVLAQKSPRTPKRAESLEQLVLATVGPEKITYAQLERVYRRNLNRQGVRLSELSRDSLESFLRLYINYRLKVLDALSRGLEQDSAIRAELEQNRRVVAESFLFDKKLVEPAVEELLRRRQWELKLAIMLFSRDFEQDTSEAYQRALHALELLRQGVPFEQLARDSSDDRETASRGGVLPYITGGMILRPIEDVAYRLKPGEVFPQPIRTRYGYFIVKLLAREPRVAVRARHILLPIVEGDTAAALAKADSLMELLRAGADFAELARQHSIDKVTAERGGELGSWYSRSLGFETIQSRLLPEFEDALFRLRDGELGTVITAFGVHIIRRDSTKRYTAEEERETLRRLYRRLYYDEDRERFLDSLRAVLQCRLEESAFAALLAAVDTTKTTFDTAWAAAVPRELLSQPLYRCQNLPTVTVGQLLDSLAQPAFRGYPLKAASLRQAVLRITTPALIAYATRNLEKEYPEFAQMLKDFRDGLLLFRVEEREVWSKLIFDTLRARAYYDSTRHRYLTEPVYDISEIYVLSDSLARALRQRLDAGADFAELAQQYTQRPGYRERKGHWGRLTPKHSKLAQLAEQQQARAGDILGPLPYEQGFVLLRINAYEPPRQKSFEEAIPDFAAAVQEQLQQELTERWLQRLRERFPVSINTAALQRITRSARRQ